MFTVTAYRQMIVSWATAAHTHPVHTQDLLSMCCVCVFIIMDQRVVPLYTTVLVCNTSDIIIFLSHYYSFRCSLLNFNYYYYYFYYIIKVLEPLRMDGGTDDI